MAVTFPDIEAWTGAETKPAGEPISCPLLTSSPIFTSGFAGAPVCWLSGITTLKGSCADVIGLFEVISFWYSGCIPLSNVAVLTIIFLLP